MHKIICLSGGLDSAVALAFALDTFPNDSISAINFKYPSNHNYLERQAASKLAEFYGVDLTTVDITDVFRGCTASLTGGVIPEGNYTDESMKSTVVPIRNIIMVSVAGSVIMSKYPEDNDLWVIIAAHSGDHPIYPDCRPSTLGSLATTLLAGSGDRLDLAAPFMSVNKAYIVSKGVALGVPFNLTRTCYTDNTIACGKCGSCRERLEAFKKAGWTDPIPYQVPV